MAEDYSTEKALYEVAMQKEMRKMTEKYEKEREQHEQDNKKWIDKYDRTVSDYEAKISGV